MLYRIPTAGLLQVEYQPRHHNHVHSIEVEVTVGWVITDVSSGNTPMQMYSRVSEKANGPLVLRLIGQGWMFQSHMATTLEAAPIRSLTVAS